VIQLTGIPEKIMVSTLVNPYLDGNFGPIHQEITASEAGDEVILIACRMSAMNIVPVPEANSDPDAGIPRLYQWRFNLKTGNVSEQMLDDVASFPG
jgi:carotenoid cleavage dioxygenase